MIIGNESTIGSQMTARLKREVIERAGKVQCGSMETIHVHDNLDAIYQGLPHVQDEVNTYLNSLTKFSTGVEVIELNDKNTVIVVGLLWGKPVASVLLEV